MALGSAMPMRLLIAASSLFVVASFAMAQPPPRERAAPLIVREESYSIKESSRECFIAIREHPTACSFSASETVVVGGAKRTGHERHHRQIHVHAK